MVIFSMNISFANDYIYIVKKNDTLSSILYENNLKPIYGKNGSLAKTLKLNPKIRLSESGNKIFPTMKIILTNFKASDKVMPAADQEIALVDPLANSKKSNVSEQLTNNRKPSDNFEQSFYWNIAPTLSWKNLSSKDENVYRSSKIAALSNTNYGIALAYGMHFEEGIDVYSKLALEHVSFIEDSIIHLEKKNFLISRFNMGILLGQKWTLEVGMNDEFFLTSPAVSRVEVKRITLPEIKSAYQKDFYQYRSAKLSYILSGTAVLPRSTPEVDSKLGFGLGAGIDAKLKNQSFFIGYDFKILKATGNSTDSHNIFWNYIWNTP